MYGMLLESVQHFIQHDYGEGVWNGVLTKAQLHNTVFTTHHRYADSTMTRLAQACADTLQDRTPNQYMCYFGCCFVKYFTHYGYDKILRVSGRHYRDFLHGIDNLHEAMRFSYPKMLSPSFYVSHEDPEGCLLHYRSKRIGFSHYVMGQLQQCGANFYKVKVKVRVLSESVTEQGYHVIYRVDFDNAAFSALTPRDSQPIRGQYYNDISATKFFQVRLGDHGYTKASI